MKKSMKVQMLFVVALLATATVASAAIVSLSSAADAMIFEQYPTDSSGTSYTTMRVWSDIASGQNPGWNEHSMVKFDLSGSGLNAADVVSAKLRLYVNEFNVAGGGGNPFIMDVDRCTADWNEGANKPTWNTHSSAYDSVASGTITLQGTEAGTYIEIDIAPALVKGWVDGSINNYGIQLVGAQYWRTYNPRFNTKEGGGAGGVYAPQLVVTSVPEPATMALLGLGVLGLLKRKKA